MTSSLIDFLSQASLVDILKVFIDANYFEVLFPFLLLFALYFHVLQKVLGRKGSKLFSKSASTIIAVIVSFYSVAFKFPTGYSVADMMMLLFPNISVISIGILCLYVIGSILGFDFFKNMFRKDISAYMIFFFGALGLGSVIFYGGIIIGIWNLDPFSQADWISVVVAISFLILGVVFLLIGWFALALLLLYVSVSFIYNMGEVGIGSLLFDPYMFILFIFIGLMSWLFKDEKNEEQMLEESMNNTQRAMSNIEQNYGGKPPQRGEDLLYDLSSQGFENSRKKLRR
ncbi:MAG: hypothetical protein LAT82_02330 [Nanoarchaeota archaeon]|nr:hypothetical protein [Nanoarchaeota archaeon]